MQFFEKKKFIGIIGGSGLCKIPELEILEKIAIKTPYGKPSGAISIGKLCGSYIAFLPRHGENHTIPPHKIPYKANLAAFKLLGIQHVIGTCVVGSLRENITPGTFVIPDQFINLTWGRDDVFDIERRFIHLPMGRPYCQHIRDVILRELNTMGAKYHSRGTVVVVQGPRFSTIAESKMYTFLGGDIVNMTQYPECYFARELGICYGAIASVTDYDVGISSSISMEQGVSEEVLATFRQNTETLLIFIKDIMRFVEEFSVCNCATNRVNEYYKSR